MTQKNNILFSTKLLQQYQKKLPNQQASSSSSAISTPRKSTSETRAENRKNRNRESRASRRRSISTDEEIDEGRDPRTITGRSGTKLKFSIRIRTSKFLKIWARFRPTALRTWLSVDPWLKVKRKKEKKMNEKEVLEVQEANVQIFH